MVDLGLIVSAQEAAQHILRSYFRKRDDTQLDPNTKSGLMQIISRLRRSLEGVSKADEAMAMRRALDVLDVDWANMTPGGRSRIVEAARQVIRESGNVIAPKVEAPLEVSVKATIKGTKRALRETQRVAIGSVTLSEADERMVRYAKISQASFVRDEYGRRSESLSKIVRNVVSRGLDEGVGRGEISERIASAMEEAGSRQSSAYWQTIAAVHTVRARSYGALSGFQDAGIAHYRYEAVLDQVTSVQCRFMHGRRFSVDKALKHYDRLAMHKNPEDVKFMMPWVRASKDSLYVLDPDGNEVPIADIESNAVGQLDEVGQFVEHVTNADLTAMGIMVPPIHAHCRSHIVPD